MANKSKTTKKSKQTSKFIITVILVIVCAIGYYYYENYYTKPEVKGELSFHFMMLGNEYAGDSVYVSAGDVDILIDAGSKKSSGKVISEYVDDYVTDGVLEYVIATHAHEDHIAGFNGEDGIFANFEVQNIIDFPKTNNSSKTLSDYYQSRDNEVALGANHFTALECYNNENGGKRVYDLTESIQMEILYNYYYDHNTKEENDFSVCVQFIHGTEKFLFTGDLEALGEEKLVEENDLSQVTLYKAGHHGSKTSSSKEFLSVIQPEYCVVCCCAGSVEYTQDFSVTFPSQKFIDNISDWTEKVFVPIMIDVEYNSSKGKYENADNYELLNGHVRIHSTESGIVVDCSNNNLYLKDTEWFKRNRNRPSNWAK